MSTVCLSKKPICTGPGLSLVVIDPEWMIDYSHSVFTTLELVAIIEFCDNFFE